MTLQQMFEDMNRAKEDPGRQPIILLLGGGMAAGKSTVREIIGKDGFWSKVYSSYNYLKQPNVLCSLQDSIDRLAVLVSQITSIVCSASNRK